MVTNLRKFLKFEEEEEEIVLVAGIDLQKRLISEAPRDTIFTILLKNYWIQTTKVLPCTTNVQAKRQILQRKPLNLKIHMRNR